MCLVGSRDGVFWWLQIAQGGLVMSSLALLAAVLPVLYACARCEQTQSAPYRLFSSRTPYSRVRGREPQEGDQAGCQATHLYVVSRHGQRFPGRDDIEAMTSHVKHVQAAITARSSNGMLSTTWWRPLVEWRPRMRPGDHLKLSGRGLRDMQGLGQRLRRLVPGWLCMDILHTDNPAARRSTHALLAGLYGQPGTNPTDHNASLPGCLDSHVSKNATRGQQLLLFLDHCDQYLRARHDPGDREWTEVGRFDRGPQLARVLEDVGLKLGLTHLTLNMSTVKALYEVCQFEYAIYGRDTWCHVFSDVSLQLLGYRQDLRYYWRYGPGREVNYRPACHLLADIVKTWRKSAQDAGIDHQVAVRIGHSRTLLPLLTLLGLFQDDSPLTSRDLRLQAGRRWRLSHVDPFGGNLVLVLLKCAGSAVRVRALLNERPLVLPGCREQLCTLNELLDAWRPALDQCNLLQLCHTEGATRQSLVHVSDLHS